MREKAVEPCAQDRPFGKQTSNPSLRRLPPLPIHTNGSTGVLIGRFSRQCIARHASHGCSLRRSWPGLLRSAVAGAWRAAPRHLRQVSTQTRAPERCDRPATSFVEAPRRREVIQREGPRPCLWPFAWRTTCRRLRRSFGYWLPIVGVFSLIEEPRRARSGRGVERAPDSV